MTRGRQVLHVDDVGVLEAAQEQASECDRKRCAIAMARRYDAANQRGMNALAQQYRHIDGIELFIHFL